MDRTIAQSSFYKAMPLRDDLGWGAIVVGLDPGEMSAPELRRNLYDLWIQEGVVLFEGIDGPKTHLELSRVFGPLRDHPSGEQLSNNVRELIDITYAPDTGWIVDVDGRQIGSWLPWHSDLVYVDKINHGGILRPIQLPKAKGETGFVDKISAYDRLPEALKARIEQLHVVYKYDIEPSHIRFGRSAEVKTIRYSAAAAGIQSKIDQFPTVMHPMVYAQPETGRKVLNVSPWFATGIFELPDGKGDALLEDVVQHVVDERFAYHHPWKMDQMVLWDNWRMLHCAAGVDADDVRRMQRTTIGGDYGLGKFEPRDGNVGATTGYLHV